MFRIGMLIDNWGAILIANEINPRATLQSHIGRLSQFRRRLTDTECISTRFLTKYVYHMLSQQNINAIIV